MLPCYIEMLFFDFHIFMEGHHIWSCILIFSPKKLTKEQLHSCVQFNYITDILQEEIINPVIG
jgi:hypothetical protein